jgi:alkaline phosphatase
MVYADINVVFGGGARHLIPSGSSYTTSFSATWDGQRTDGENLIDVLTDRGYEFVDSEAGMAALLPGDKAWGMFDDSHMDPDLDRDELHPTQPSIAAMTAKAIELLNDNPTGFFLMVEGSQVDWAGHANDAAYMVYDFLAFDEAVGVARAFADVPANDTLLLVFPDHNTGALSVGHEQSDFPPGYTGTSLEAMIDPIKDAKMTIQGLLYRITTNAGGNYVPKWSELIDTFAEYLGPYYADYMTKEQATWIAKTLRDQGPYDGYYPIAQYVSQHLTPYGWTTHGHTGEDVPLWSLTGSPTIDRPVGTFDNNQLATIGAAAFGYGLNASTAWDMYDESVLDTTDLDANPVANINGVLYPVSKDIKIDNGGETNLSDITVYAPAIGKVFIPKQ